MEKLIAEMSDLESSNEDFHFPMKKCWKVGDKIMLVSIDSSIVEKLEIDENYTFLEQKVTDNGDILMRIRRIKI